MGRRWCVGQRALLVLSLLCMLSGCKETEALIHVTSAAEEGTMSKVEEWGVGAGLREPSDLAVDYMSRRVIVSDTMNHRLVVFDMNGRVASIIGGYGQGPGEFDRPCGIDVDDSGNIFIADSYNRRVQKLAPDGQPVWTTQPASERLFFNDVAVLDSGDVLAITAGRLPDGSARVHRFGAEGQSKGSFVGSALGYLGAYGDRVYVNNSFLGSGPSSHCLECYDKEGEMLWRRPYDLSHAKGDIAFDPTGNLLIVHTGLARVTKYDPSGEEIEVLMELPRRTSTFALLWSAEMIDPRRLVVLDTTNGLLMVYEYDD